jgi:hypothetical protein
VLWSLPARSADGHDDGLAVATVTATRSTRHSAPPCGDWNTATAEYRREGWPQGPGSWKYGSLLGNRGNSLEPQLLTRVGVRITDNIDGPRTRL